MLKDFDLKSIPITELMNEIASRDGIRNVEVRYQSGAVAFAMCMGEYNGHQNETRRKIDNHI